MSKLSLQVWPSVLIWLLLCPAASIRGLQAPPLNATEPGYSPAEEEMARALVLAHENSDRIQLELCI